MDIQTAQKRFPIGKKVTYYPLLTDRSQCHVGEVRSQPWACGGSLLVKITGKAGGVCIEHLEYHEEESLS